MRFSRSIPFYIVTITATAVVTEAPAKAEDAYTVIDTYYMSSHPWGGCNAILRRESARKGDASKKTVKYLFSRRCAFRDPHFKPWEQEFAGVQEIKGPNVIYIPAQKMLDGRNFPGNYWCPWASANIRIWRAGYCTKDGFLGTKRY